MKEVGVVRVRTSILQRQNTVAQFIAMRPILGLCEVAERRPGTQVPQRWREQTGMDWNSAREKAAAEEGENKAEPELTGSELESEPETTPVGTVGGTGEEASLGDSGSSGAGWIGVERSGEGRRIDQTGV